MENLLSCHGREFSAIIGGVEVIGKVTVEDGNVYLCQNKIYGNECYNKQGYKYSWAVDKGDHFDLTRNSISCFVIDSIINEKLKRRFEYLSEVTGVDFKIENDNIIFTPEQLDKILTNLKLNF